MNPFIELWRDPVGALTWLGYLLGLATLVVLTLAACWRNVIMIRARWENERPHKWEFHPPASWLARVAAVPAILAVDAWALAAVVWLLS